MVAGCGRIGFDLAVPASSDGQGSSLESGLVAWWKLDETTGMRAADASGHGLDGALSGSPIWLPDVGPSGGALRFHPITKDVVVANFPALHLRASLSIAAWVNFATLSGSLGIDREDICGIGTDSPGFFEYLLEQDRHCGGEHAGLRISSDGVNAFAGPERCSNTVIVAGRWYHVVGVYDASALELHTYVDGVLDDGAMCPGTTCGTTAIPPAISNSTDGFDLGTDGNLASGPDAQYADVRVYDRALAATDVSSLYTQGSISGDD